MQQSRPKMKKKNNCSLSPQSRTPPFRRLIYFFFLISTSSWRRGWRQRYSRHLSLWCHKAAPTHSFEANMTESTGHCCQPIDASSSFSKMADNFILFVPSFKYPFLGPKLIPSCLPTVHVLTACKNLGVCISSKAEQKHFGKPTRLFHYVSPRPRRHSTGHSWDWSVPRTTTSPTAPRRRPRCHKSKPPTCLFLAAPRKILTPTRGHQWYRHTPSWLPSVDSEGLYLCPLHTQRLWYRSTCLPRIWHPPIHLVRFFLSNLQLYPWPQNHMSIPLLLDTRWPDCHCTDLGLLRPSSSCFFLLKQFFFSSRSSLLIGGALCTSPPISGWKQIPKHGWWSRFANTSCERRMPPSFARAQRRPGGKTHPFLEHVAFLQILVVVFLVFSRL